MTDIEEKKRRAADPTTPGDELARLANGPPASVATLARRNPSLPSDALREWLVKGWPDAWMNPSVPLLLLLEPNSPELRAGALEYATRRVGLPWEPAAIEVLQSMWAEASDLDDRAKMLDPFLNVVKENGQTHRMAVSVLAVAVRTATATATAGPPLKDALSILTAIERWCEGADLSFEEKQVLVKRAVEESKHLGRMRHATGADTLEIGWMWECALAIAWLSQATRLSYDDRSIGVLGSLGDSLLRAEAIRANQNDMELSVAVFERYPRFPLVGLDPED